MGALARDDTKRTTGSASFSPIQAIRLSFSSVTKQRHLCIGQQLDFAD
jgi:hypothetical protein